MIKFTFLSFSICLVGGHVGGELGQTDMCLLKIYSKCAGYSSVIAHAAGSVYVVSQSRKTSEFSPGESHQIQYYLSALPSSRSC